MGTFDDILSRIMSVTNAASEAEINAIFGITRQAVSNARAKGRPPKTWLRTLRDRYGVNPEWILTGQGERATAKLKIEVRTVSIPGSVPGHIQRTKKAARGSDRVTSAAGRLVGDTLYDLVQGRFYLAPEDFGEACGIAPGEWGEILASRSLPWTALRALAMRGVNLNFLLADQWPDVFPTEELGRALFALGLENNTAAFAKLVDAEYTEVEAVRQQGKEMPFKWRRACIERLGINPAWLSDGHLPTHLPFDEERAERAAPTPPPAGQVTGPAPTPDPLTGQMEAFERIMRARNAPDEEVRDGLLALVRNYRPGYPTAEVQQGAGPYGSLGEAAEEPAAYDKKKSVG